MDASVIGQIAALKKMAVGELRVEWERLCDEPTRSRNRDYLWRRLAWRVQELTHGGLSDAAKARIIELADDTFTRARAPRGAADAVLAASERKPERGPRRIRDPRLPSPGTVLSRQYHGQEIRVLALEDGFEWDGQHFGSLSALARTVTGQRWNGLLFFGLTERIRKP